MSKDYKLSEELREVMDEAFDHAKSNNLGEISLESVEYFLILRYLDGNGESMILKKIFDELSGNEALNLKNVFIEAMEDFEKYCLHQENNGLFDKDQIIISDGIAKVMDRIKKARDIMHDLRPDAPETEVNSEEFFSSMLFEENTPNAYLKTLGINNMKLLIEKGASLGFSSEEDF